MITLVAKYDTLTFWCLVLWPSAFFGIYEFIIFPQAAKTQNNSSLMESEGVRYVR